MANEDVPASFRQWYQCKPLSNDEPLSLDHFARRELPVPDLEDGQALVRVRVINLHANTRRRMVGGIIPLGGTDNSNYAYAEVVASRDPIFPVGAAVTCQAGWQDYQVISSSAGSISYGAATPLVAALNRTKSQWTYVIREEITQIWRPTELMHVLGTSGMTAYFGVRECGPLMPGDAVVVANAGGAVGTVVAQLAKHAGCRVIGIAGGTERCAQIAATLGIDDCLDHRAADFDSQLAARFPYGIDFFSDGVAGESTARIARLMNRNSRLLAYGSASHAYSPEVNPRLESVKLRTRDVFVSEDAEKIIAEKNIKVESWIVQDFYHERLKAEDDLSRLRLAGSLKPMPHVIEGFERLPEAILALYERQRIGKLQISFDPPEMA